MWLQELLVVSVYVFVAAFSLRSDMLLNAIYDLIQQVEFVAQLSAVPSNTVFAINRSSSTQLDELIKSRPDGGKNIHVLRADITDHSALKVRPQVSYQEIYL